VKRTFNDIALQPALAEQRVRADIIGGVKFTADVVRRDLEITRFDGNGAVHFNRLPVGNRDPVFGFLH
jgi:hypothetical protein